MEPNLVFHATAREAKPQISVASSVFSYHRRLLAEGAAKLSTTLLENDTKLFMFGLLISWIALHIMKKHTTITRVDDSGFKLSCRRLLRVSLEYVRGKSQIRN
jgi:hypothetical protein